MLKVWLQVKRLNNFVQSWLKLPNSIARSLAFNGCDVERGSDKAVLESYALDSHLTLAVGRVIRHCPASGVGYD